MEKFLRLINTLKFQYNSFISRIFVSSFRGYLRNHIQTSLTQGPSQLNGRAKIVNFFFRKIDHTFLSRKGQFLIKGITYLILTYAFLTILIPFIFSYYNYGSSVLFYLNLLAIPLVAVGLTLLLTYFWKDIFFRFLPILIPAVFIINVLANLGFFQHQEKLEFFSIKTLIAIKYDLILAIIYGLITWLIIGLFRRLNLYLRQIIVVPIAITSETESVQVQSIGTLFSQNLVNELKRIVQLSNLKKVETANPIRIESDEVRPILVSNLESMGADNFNPATTIELAGAQIKLPIPFTLINRVMISLAKYRIQGNIIHRKNNTFEIFLEFRSRDKSQAFLVKDSLLPYLSTEQLSDEEIAKKAKKIAVKIMYRLGCGHPFFSNIDSFFSYLEGLEASQQQKWWLAISHYRTAIEIEETYQERFGVGHYLLGTAFVSLGNLKKGFTHLKLAEQHGPPLPEVQYMLALTMLYRHSSILHQAPQPNLEFYERSGDNSRDRLKQAKYSFEQIRDYCKNAILLRPRFAEAYHLLGMAYYIRGRLRERETTRCYGAKTRIVEGDYREDYELAFENYIKAIRLYRKVVFEFAYEEFPYKNLGSPLKDYNEMLVVIHQLADVFRGLRKYSQAIINYELVLKAHPQNLRTLIDLAKTYCIARDWDAAEKILLNRIQIHRRYIWDADVNFYLGWTYAGKINTQKTNDFQLQLSWLLKSFKHLDYAFLQRPRFISHWSQNNWSRDFFSAIKLLKEKCQDSTKSNYYFHDLSRSGPHALLHSIEWWISWRLYLLEFNEDNIPDDKSSILNAIWASNLEKCYISLPHIIRDIFENSSFLDSAWNATFNGRTFLIRDFNVPQIPIWRIVDQVKLLMRHKARLLKSKSIKFDEQSRFSEIRIRELHETIDLFRPASQSLDIWNILEKNFSRFIKDPLANNSFETISLSERWYIELYAEVSSLSASFLANSREYITLVKTMNTATQRLLKWSKKWEKIYSCRDTQSSVLDKHFRFTPLIMRYQIASLFAWQGFGYLRLLTDPIGKLNLEGVDQAELAKIDLVSSSEKYLDSDLLSKILECLTVVFENYPSHPLGMYINAEVLRVQRQFDAAAAELQILLKITEPFDPSRTIAHVSQNSREKQERDSVRRELYYLEKVVGRQRFEDFINPPHLHARLSRIYFEADKFELSVEQLSIALSMAPPIQLFLRDFLILANRLKNLSRFEESEAVLEGINISLKRERPNEVISLFSYQALRILKAVLKARKGEFGKALEMANFINKGFSFTNYQEFVKSFSNSLSINNESRKILNTIISALNRLRKNFEEVNFNDNKSIYKTINEIWLEVELKCINLYTSTYNTIQDSTHLEKSPSPEVKKPEEPQYTFDESKRSDLYCVIAIFLAGLNRSKKTFPDEIKDIFVYSEKNLEQRVQCWQRQFLFRLSEAAIEELIRLSDLYNCLAYSKAELDIDLATAKAESEFAICLLTLLLKIIPEKILRRRTSRVRGKLAQNYDTLSWIYFRASNMNAVQGTNNQLNLLYKAQTYALIALKYKQQDSVLYYHLARIHLTLLEVNWHTLEDKSEKKMAEIAPIIDKNLRLAFRHWRSSRRFDKAKRLHFQLTWLGERLNSYQERWVNMHFESFNQSYRDKRNILHFKFDKDSNSNNNEKA